MTFKDNRNLPYEDGAFLAIVLLVTIAFTWLVAPYFGPILWGIVAAILFSPMQRGLVRRLGGRAGLAATLTLLTIIMLVILPAILIGTSLVQEAALIYDQLRSGQIDLGAMAEAARANLPRWAERRIVESGLTDFEKLREMLGSSIASGLQSIASQALGFGQGALSFLAGLGVMLYLTFFLLRDGDAINASIRKALPLRPRLRDELFRHFAVVIRATMKGSVVVAILQGIIGGLIFWFLDIKGALLWGVLMGFFSLVPAVGTGIIWVPMAIYLFLTGSIWEGAILTGCGIFVIGLIDNLLRPILVGQETRMPDFVVLISTLAGIELFGLNGFIMGPMIAALFIAVWNMVSDWRNQHGLAVDEAA